MALDEHQRRHLLTCYLAITELLDEMEGVACSGRATAAPGAVLAPLPQGWWARLTAPLERIRDQLRDLVIREAPDELRAHEATQPLASTMRWLSLLLRRLGEEIEDLDPERLQRRYGSVPGTVAHDLDALQAGLAAELAQAREELDRLRGGRTPGQ